MNKKTISSEKYSGVYYVEALESGKKTTGWYAKIESDGARYGLGYFDSEREAAIAIDKKLISLGKQPKHIFKRQTA